jgi:hypothetical protein
MLALHTQTAAPSVISNKEFERELKERRAYPMIWNCTEKSASPVENGTRAKKRPPLEYLQHTAIKSAGLEQTSHNQSNGVHGED